MYSSYRLSLDNGSFFNRYEFEDISIIEIRPQYGIFSSALDPLKFSVDKINIWMEQGYKDSMRILKESFDALESNYERLKSEKNSDDAIKRLLEQDFSIPNDR